MLGTSSKVEPGPGVGVGYSYSRFGGLTHVSPTGYGLHAVMALVR